MTFKVVDANGFETAAKTATVNVCALPTLSSVKFGNATAKVKEEISIKAVTSTSTTKIVMYSDGKAVKTWTEKYSDNGSKRTWDLTFAFSGAGSRTLTFKAFNAAGTESAAKEASIKITK